MPDQVRHDGRMTFCEFIKVEVNACGIAFFILKKDRFFQDTINNPQSSVSGTMLV